MDIVINHPFCRALAFVTRVFQLPWGDYVIPQLMSLADENRATFHKLQILFHESCKHDLAMMSEVTIQKDRLTYQTLDRRYLGEITTTEAGEALLRWTIKSGDAIIYNLDLLFPEAGFRVVHEKYSVDCALNPALLALVGGELVGQMAVDHMIPESSFLFQANERRVIAESNMKDTFRRQLPVEL